MPESTQPEVEAKSSSVVPIDPDNWSESSKRSMIYDFTKGCCPGYTEYYEDIPYTCAMCLDRNEFGTKGPICRLEYRGGMEKWGFAIYRYSHNYYDPDEYSFPGYEHVDGTVEGALKAALQAYP